VAESLARLDFFNDPEAYDKQQELKAMAVAADAVIRFAERHAELAERMAAEEPIRAARPSWSESPRSAAACPRTRPATSGRRCNLLVRPPGRGHRAEHLGFVLPRPSRPASCIPSTSAKSTGSLTREQAQELLECFWVKFNNQPAPPKVGVTAAESGTYTDFCNINTGGLKPDGSSA
jgi:hypothetical protein